MKCLFPLLIVCLLVLPSCSKSQDQHRVQLINVVDGDSIVVTLDGKTINIRLYGIDAPEIPQAHGQEASRALQELLAGRELTITPMTEDRYHRTVALVFADGRDVSEAMIAGGWAWVYHRYCKISPCRQWRQAQEKAREAKLGLWRAPDPQTPWDWRRGKGQYSANVKSRVFHRHSCKNARCKHCTRFFEKREEAIEAGFKPCGRCNP